jgi:hypothetical protein
MANFGQTSASRRSVEYVEKALDGGTTPRHNVLLVQF